MQYQIVNLPASAEALTSAWIQIRTSLVHWFTAVAVVDYKLNFTPNGANLDYTWCTSFLCVNHNGFKGTLECHPFGI